MRSLRDIALRGALWTIAGHGASQVVRLASSLILTRLLVPEFFGLMAIVNTLMMGVQLFSDMGIAQSIVTSQRGEDPSFLNTAWTLQIMRGVVLAAVFAMLAAPVALFYKEPRLFYLMPVVGLSALTEGLVSTKVPTLQRRLDLGKYYLFDVGIQIPTMAFVIAWASISPTVWALAAGGLLASSLRAVTSHWLLSSYRNRLAWDRSALDGLISFGKWFFLSSALMFLSEQSDRLILGRLVGLRLLGVYAIAYALASVPRELIKLMSSRVIFPALARDAHLPRPAFLGELCHHRRMLLAVSAVLVAGLIAAGDRFIVLLYDDRYRDAAWMTPLLALGLWFFVLYNTSSPALIALGKPWFAAQSNLSALAWICVGVPVGFHALGAAGAVAAVALSDLPRYLVNLYGLRREKLGILGQDGRASALFAGVLALFLVVRTLGFGVSMDSLRAPGFGGTVRTESAGEGVSTR